MRTRRLRADVDAALEVAGIQFVATSIVPRSIGLFLPAPFLTWRGFIAHQVMLWGLVWSLRWWIFPRMKAWGDRFESERVALADRLGRPPTDTEIMANWRAVKAAVRYS